MKARLSLAYLHKPFEMDELVDLVQRQFGG
jgi:hypothetical protein